MRLTNVRDLIKTAYFAAILCGTIQAQSDESKTSVKYTTENGYNNCAFHLNGEEFFLTKHLNDRNNVIFDVGANIGEWSSIAAQCAPNAVIYAFEPHPAIFEILKARATSNSIVCHQLALSDREKTLDLWVWGDSNDLNKSGLNGLYYRPILKDMFNQTPERTAVHAITLDDFCQQNQINHIDFLKIDTEGSESDVLRGSASMISNHCIDTIQFEYGGCYIDSKTKLESIYHYLKSNGYSIFRILPDRLLPIPVWDSELENFQYSNYVAILKQE
ncbi:MAG: FkbM family methyltransferase [Verrucomicrobia bacterium]|nr:FkbM family methyltransferase [Verrucomicrobiota bacterium]